MKIVHKRYFVNTKHFVNIYTCKSLNNVSNL